MEEPVPAVVTLHVWRVPLRAASRAAALLAGQRRQLRRLDGLTFAKLLGTGADGTFRPGDADLRRWAALCCWQSEAAAAAFDSSPVAAAFDRLAEDRGSIELSPLAARGRWAGRQPFGDPAASPAASPAANPAASPAASPVAALTRARLRPTKMVQFWRAVRPVAEDLHRQDGLLLAFGIGEAPIGWQGTFSVWASRQALTEFAYRRPAHQEVIAATPREGWYAEELFARFAVRSAHGSLRAAASQPD
ncbi:MAG: monooxygenase [Mycobacteriales bacterium]